MFIHELATECDKKYKALGKSNVYVAIRRASTGYVTNLIANCTSPHAVKRVLNTQDGGTRIVGTFQYVPVPPVTTDHFPSIVNLCAGDWDYVKENQE